MHPCYRRKSFFDLLQPSLESYGESRRSNGIPADKKDLFTQPIGIRKLVFEIVNGISAIVFWKVCDKFLKSSCGLHKLFNNDLGPFFGDLEL